MHLFHLWPAFFFRCLPPHPLFLYPFFPLFPRRKNKEPCVARERDSGI